MGVSGDRSDSTEIVHIKSFLFLVPLHVTIVTETHQIIWIQCDAWVCDVGRINVDNVMDFLTSIDQTLGKTILTKISDRLGI